MYIIKRHDAAMEASETGVASTSEGIVMTDRENEVQRPRDANGISLNQLQIVQIMEVPTYLVSGLLGGDDGEKELAQRIKSLKLGYGLIISPADSPDISWHSRDNDYVYLDCKAVFSRNGSELELWSMEQFFPASCVRRLPTNIFLSAVFSGSPWPGENFLDFAARALTLPFEELNEMHERHIQLFLGSHD